MMRMMMKRYLWMASLACVVVLVGAGCRNGVIPSPFTEHEIQRAGELSQLSPADAAARISFLPGDTFEIQQTMLGFGAVLPELLGQRDGMKQVTVNRFAPTHTAEVKWQMTVKHETQSSREAREAYERARDAGEAATLPAATYETSNVTGTMIGIGLQSPHTAYLPAFWQEGEMDLRNERSGLWLSDDAYLELSKTGQTILNLGVFDEETNRIAHGLQEVDHAMATLRARANEDGRTHDLTLLKADAERLIVPLEVNGMTVNVSAIRARNWFGEITVLDNRQNPLILQVTIHPLSAGLADLLGGGLTSLDHLLGYQITKVRVQAP